MRNIRILSYVTVILLSSALCSNVSAETTSNTVNSGKGLTCRLIIVNGVMKEQDYCGTDAQWAEFDRRVKLINAGVTCRRARSARELCMNAEQWKVYDHRARNFAGLASTGMRGDQSALSNPTQNPAVTVYTSQGMPVQIPASMQYSSYGYAASQ